MKADNFRRHSVAWTGIVLALALVLPATAAELSGTIGLLKKGGRAPLANTGEGFVVFYTPDQHRSARPGSGRSLTISTEGKRFVPSQLTVPLGAKVQFPNTDPILHNVFSVSPANEFDLGLYGTGESASVEPRSTGIVRVFCNVHRDMVAHLFVVDTPFVVHPAADGSFSLNDLPEGRGVLTAWHARTEPLSLEVELPAEDPLALEVEVSKPRLPPHLNKNGLPYNRRSGRRYDG